MRAKPESMWELALAIVAFAGAFTLLRDIFEFIPSYVYGVLFAVAFVLMLVAWFYRNYYDTHPVKVTATQVHIDTLEARSLLQKGEYGAPSLNILMSISSRDKLNLNADMRLKLDKGLRKTLKNICGKLPSWFYFRTANMTQSIVLDKGSYLVRDIVLLFEMNKKFDSQMDEQLESVSLKNKVKIGWNFVDGEKVNWIKAIE